MEILDYVNGKTSNHLLTVLFGMIVGALYSFVQYQETGGSSDPFGSFMLMTAVSLTIAALLGWIVSIVFSDEALILLVANWMLIVCVVVYAILTVSTLTSATML